MLDPFHIAKGRLYIHTIILFRKRIVPLAEIRQIDIDYVRREKNEWGTGIICTLQGKMENLLLFILEKAKETRSY